MSGLIFNLSRWTLALFPPTWPSKIYNTFIKVPFIKKTLSQAIQKVTPDYVILEEGKLIFDKGDPVMSGGISLGKYEPVTVAFFRSHLKVGMTVVDIGANIGYFTVIAASRVGPSGKVFSYEPDPHNFSILERNIAANAFKNVKTVPIALADRAGTRELFFGDNQCTHSFGDKRGTGRSESVRTETLDSSLAALGSPKIDMIKIDIEGAEPMAFDGMTETLARNPNIIVLCEFYPNAIKCLGYSPLKFLEKLRGLGFSLSVIDEDHDSRTPIIDLASFNDSFGDREASRNLIAVRN